MNAKNEPTYVLEEAVTQPWIKSRGVKLTAIIAGGVMALGGAFGAGLVIGRHVNFDIDRHFGIQGFGRDGDQDHGFNPNGGGVKGFGGDGQPQQHMPGDQSNVGPFGGSMVPGPTNSQTPSAKNG